MFIYLGMGYNLLANAIATILFGALCAPRDGQPYIVQYSSPLCRDNADNLTLALTVVNLVSDLYLLSLPLPLVWKLQLPAKRKFGLITIFLTGILYSCRDRDLIKSDCSHSACISSLSSIIVRVLWAHNPDYNYWSPVLVYTSYSHSNIDFGQIAEHEQDHRDERRHHMRLYAGLCGNLPSTITRFNHDPVLVLEK